MKKLFTDHPHGVGETYFQHLCAASQFGFVMIFAGVASVLHSIFPFIFVTTTSKNTF